MQDVAVTVTVSSSTSLSSVLVKWVKNSDPPVVVPHAVGVGGPYTWHYLADIGSTAATAPGDVISASVAEADASGNVSAYVPSTPASVMIPNTAPLPPTSVVLFLG